MKNYFDIFEKKVLSACQKPARYIGEELNSIKKEWTSTHLKWGLVFPDLYELGGSNLGISILYSILNKQKEILAERFFMPALDAIKLMEENKLPPLSLENKMPANKFDIIGITLPYELTVTNILKFLQLSFIPINSKDREGFPLIIGGGALAFNPLPLADFFDVFVVGDGEEAVLEISKIVLENKHSKNKTLALLNELAYTFVPSLHNNEKKIHKAVVKDLNEVDAGLPLVPLIETTFNRLSIEAARGCTRGCRFCFAGMTQRPYRERDISKLANLFMAGLIHSGFDEFSPSSLSISDFSAFPQLFDCLYNISNIFKTSLSLPSLRVGSIKSDVAQKISSFRKTGFTIAPETYPSFQTNLNKNIDYEDLEKDIKTAFDMGWQNIKLYYMIGLPNEEEKGLYDIKYFVKSLLKTFKNSVNITLSFSTFVPKPHTPLQWSAMNNLSEIQKKQEILKSLFFKEKKIFLRLHNPYMSILEGLISRGDQKVGVAIQNAFENGAIFDAWDEHMHFEYWQEGLDNAGVNIDNYLSGFSLDEKLPWDFISTGVSPSFLISEYKNYHNKVATPDCRFGKCSNCGVCDFKTVKNIFSKEVPALKLFEQKDNLEKKRYLLIYEKKGPMRYLGNLDIMRLWHRLLKISEVPLSYTKGFNPQPVIDGGWATPLGVESHCEVLAFESSPLHITQISDRLNKVMPDGLKIVSLSEIFSKEAMDRYAKVFQFKLCFPVIVNDDIDAITVKRKDKEKRFMIKEFIKDVNISEDATFFTIELKEGGLKPLEFASFLAKRDVSAFEIVKTKVFLDGGHFFGS